MTIATKSLSLANCVTTPAQPEVEITIEKMGAGLPMPEADKTALADLLAKGVLDALTFDVEDVDALFEHVAPRAAR